MIERSRKRLFGILRILVSALLLYLVWRTASSKGDVAGILRGVDFQVFIAATAAFAAGQGIAALRLRFALGTLHRRIGFRSVLRAHFVGISFNQVLPTGFGGDIVKILVLRRPGDTGRFTRAILLVRGFGLMALLLATILLVPFYPRLLNETRPFHIIAMISAVIVLGLIIATLSVGSRRFPGASFRAVRLLALLLKDLRRFSRLQPLVEAGLTSTLVVLSVVVCFALLSRSLGHPAGFLTYLVMVPPIIVSMHLPLSFGGWGIREVGAVALLPLGGVPTEIAFLTSVLYGIVIMICGVVGLVLWHLPDRGREGSPRTATPAGVL